MLKDFLNELDNEKKMQLDCSIYNIKVLEEKLEKERQNKNTLVQHLSDFYTKEFSGKFFKMEDKTKKIGQIKNVFYKGGKFYIKVSFIDITVNSKVRKLDKNLELYGDEVSCMKLISEDEYKIEFFNFVNNNIKIVENENEDCDVE